VKQGCVEAGSKFVSWMMPSTGVGNATRYQSAGYEIVVSLIDDVLMPSKPV
jgi:hypothetical protein